MSITYRPNSFNEGRSSGDDLTGARSSVFFENITLYRQANNGVINRVTFLFNTYAGPGGMDYTRLKLDINGVQVRDDNNTIRGPFFVDWDTSRTPFLNINTPITTISFYGQAIAKSNTNTAETAFTRNFKLLAVNPDTDMIFVDTVNTIPSYLCLPSVSSPPRKNLLFIKDRGGNAGGNNIEILSAFSETQCIEEINDYSAIMNANWGCMKLIYSPNNQTWFVADYYRGNIPSTNTYNPADIAADNAISPNTISIFNTDVAVSGYKPDRNAGGDNIIRINPPTSGYSVAIICYCGTTTANRALVIQSNGFSLDQFTGQNGTQTAYVRSDGNYKSTGVVFISDGSKWYIAGYMETYGWEWKNGDNVPGYGGISTDLIVGGDYNADNSIFAFTVSNNDVFQNIYVGDAQVSIIKKYSTPNYWPRVCVRNSTTNGNPATYLSQNFTSMEFSYSDGSGRAGRHSVWVVREPRPLGAPTAYHFHPVMRMFRESQGL